LYERETGAEATMLQMNVEKVCYVIVKAREFDVQEAPLSEDDAGNMVDNEFRETLAEDEEDATEDELTAFIDAMNEDEQCELVALAWLGRGDYTTEEWAEAVETARSRREGSTADYLLGIPVLADYLEEGLSQFELSCADVELAHL